MVGGADGFQNVLRITVLEISGGKVKLGFDADAGIRGHREEVWQRIRSLRDRLETAIEQQIPQIRMF